MPEELCTFLADGSITKVGVGIGQDASKVWYYKFPANIIF
jgi:hypothetical protein